MTHIATRPQDFAPNLISLPTAEMFSYDEHSRQIHALEEAGNGGVPDVEKGNFYAQLASAHLEAGLAAHPPKQNEKNAPAEAEAGAEETRWQCTAAEHFKNVISFAGVALEQPANRFETRVLAERLRGAIPLFTARRFGYTGALTDEAIAANDAVAAQLIVAAKTAPLHSPVEYAQQDRSQHQACFLESDFRWGTQVSLGMQLLIARTGEILYPGSWREITGRRRGARATGHDCYNIDRTEKINGEKVPITPRYLRRTQSPKVIPLSFKDLTVDALQELEVTDTYGAIESEKLRGYSEGVVEALTRETLGESISNFDKELLDVLSELVCVQIAKRREWGQDR